MIFHLSKISPVQKNFKIHLEKFHLKLILNNHSADLKIKKL